MKAQSDIPGIEQFLMPNERVMHAEPVLASARGRFSLVPSGCAAVLTSKRFLLVEGRGLSGADPTGYWFGLVGVGLSKSLQPRELKLLGEALLSECAVRRKSPPFVWVVAGDETWKLKLANKRAAKAFAFP